MKVCMKCNENYDDEFMFCPKCGSSLIKDDRIKCPNCKKLLDKDFIYCPYCGCKLSSDDGGIRESLEEGNNYYYGNGVEQSYSKAAEIFSRLAEQGDAEAQNRLGFLYDHGQGVELDHVKAARWFRKAAEQGYAKAQYNLGILYDKGQGIEQDYVKAAKWYEKAAEQGYADAQFKLGLMYYDGQGVEQDYVKTAKWLRKAAEQGCVRAQGNLGVLYYNGIGVKQDYVKAAKWFRKAAEQGDAEAQFNLGLMHNNGQGVTQDSAKAAVWFRKAGEQGDAEAQTRLGVMYGEGKGVKQDYVKAAKWLRKAAEQGDVKAQNNLSVLYYNGQGVKQDYVKAAEWCRKAAEQGHTDAQYHLGSLYESGKGVERDRVKAEEWYTKAAEQGHADAQYRLGSLCRSGYVKAAEWYTKAAEQGHVDAQYRLGDFYYYGTGVERDYVKAAEWYKKAAEQGLENAQSQVGSMYYKGKGVEQDYVKAAEWYKKAAIQGDYDALYRLGEMNENGKGAPPDFNKAWKWYKKAIEHGYKGKIMLMQAPEGFPFSALQELVAKAKQNGNILRKSDINDAFPFSINNLESINFTIKYLNNKKILISYPRIPEKYVLYCNYPGKKFKESIDASNIRESYTFDSDSYRAELKKILSEKLTEQDFEKFLGRYFTEDEVPARGHFRFSELRTEIFGNDELPINERIKVYLDSIRADETIIKTEEINVKDYVDLNSKKEFLMEYGLWNATDEYIEIALEKFVKETGWHIGLKKGNNRIEDVALWPSPKENGTWVEKDGAVLHPCLWYGYNDGRAFTEEEDKTWNIINGLEFWFSEEPEDYIIEYDDERFAGYFNGIIPDIKAIRKSCPILLQADDTPEGIEKKVQAYCVEQYRNKHPEKTL